MLTDSDSEEQPPESGMLHSDFYSEYNSRIQSVIMDIMLCEYKRVIGSIVIVLDPFGAVLSQRL